MFKIVKKETFQWPVQVNVPIDHGTFKTYSFTAEFKMLPQSDIDQLIAKSQAGDTDFIKDILVGWEAVQDSDGNDFPYSDENKLVLIDITYVRSGLVEAYFKAVSGKKISTKNS